MDERAWLGLRSCLQGAQKETLSPDAGKARARPQPQWQGGEAESLRSGWTSCSPGAPHPGALAPPSLLAHLRAQSQFIWRWDSARPWKGGLRVQGAS